MSWKIVVNKKGPRTGENSGLEIASAGLKVKLNDAIRDSRLENIFLRGSQKTLSFDDDIHIDCQLATATVQIYAVQRRAYMYASIQLAGGDKLTFEEFRIGLLKSLEERTVFRWDNSADK